MKRPRRAGRTIRVSSGDEHFEAFVPAPLPPDPPLLLPQAQNDLLARASLSLGRLDGISVLLPDPGLFLYMYVRKEAVLSSQIEGTQSSLSDLLLFESESAPGVPEDDVQEVSNYVAAMEHGLRRLRGGFPLSLRLIREIHEILMRGVRGGSKAPGEFRRSQNWIGGSRPGNARYVPPPPHEMMDALGEFEKFLHVKTGAIPTLVKAGLAHAQFESIHPFLDGNGRVGRLLITFLLCAEEILSQPLLYLSLFLKEHRTAYYDALQRIRDDADWEGWIEFFLTGVAEVSEGATTAAQKMIALFEKDRAAIQKQHYATGPLEVHDLLKRRGVISVRGAARDAAMSYPAATRAVSRLVDLGIVKEITGRTRDRRYMYSSYVKLLNEGTKR
jgi:Fic family protein